jgi:hypothetical protein
MEFLVIAHDRTDDEALARRMVVRQWRLAAARRAIRSGNVLFGGATLGEGEPYPDGCAWRASRHGCRATTG